MLEERLQVLVTADQRRRLESEARRRGTSVGGLIRAAVDAHLGQVSQAARLHALEGIRTSRGRFLSPDEVNRLAAAEHDDALARPG